MCSKPVGDIRRELIASAIAEEARRWQRSPELAKGRAMRLDSEQDVFACLRPNTSLVKRILNATDSQVRKMRRGNRNAES